MKKYIKSILVALSLIPCIISSIKLISINAETNRLNAGREVNISGLNGSLNNINIKIEFTTNVNLDGTNNALLIGLTSSDGTILTDARFVVSSTNIGVYDENGVALIFENAPSVIGSKTTSGSTYTYTIETRDFSVVNSYKNIAKLVIVGQKGTEISSNVSFSEVKYSVKFGNNPQTLYSYNELITTCPIGDYAYNLSGHGEVNVWRGDDSSLFQNGTTRATKNIVYTGSAADYVSHSWSNVNEVPASRGVNGIKAHQVCTVCGAKRINTSSASLATDEDLVLVHTCTYNVAFNWNNATNPGDKPTITYVCSDANCNYTHTMSSNTITITEKNGSRVNPTCNNLGSVTYIASCTYEEQYASEEKVYILPKTEHVITHKDAVQPTCTTSGNKEYYWCSNCSKYYSDANGVNEILNPQSSLILPATGHNYGDAIFTWTQTSNGYMATAKCVCANNGSHVLSGNASVTSKIINETCTTSGLVTYTATISLNGETYTDTKVVTKPALGHNLVNDQYVAPTCTNTGKTSGHHCTRCDYTDGSETIPAIGHSWSWVVDKAATYYETGLKHEECSVCHERRNENTVIEKVECLHNLVLTPQVNPTCTTQGSKSYYTCSSCHKHFSDAEGQLEITNLDSYLPIAPLGHTIVTDSALSPTCTMPGKTEGKHCSLCNEVIIPQNIISELGHNLVEDPKVDATCTTDGKTLGHHCTRCNYTDGGMTIPALGHKEVIDQGIAPTCTTPGKTEGKHCSVCNEILVPQDTISATGHTVVIDTKKDATCTETGLTEGKHCSLCNEVIIPQEIIPLKEHSLTHHDAVEATCTTPGNIEYYECSMCHKMFSDSNGINEIENVVLNGTHTLSFHKGVPATCTTDGVLDYYECSVCHKKFTDEECTNEITNTTWYAHHTYTKHDAVEANCTTIGNIEYYYCSVCEKYFNMDGLEIYDPFIPYKHIPIKYNSKPATCTADGSIEYYECSECHKKFSDFTCTNEITDVTIKSSGHKYGSDGRCSICGKTDPTYTPPSKGCKSSISVYGVVTVLSIAAIIIKRKRKYSK